MFKHFFFCNRPRPSGPWATAQLETSSSWPQGHQIVLAPSSPPNCRPVVYVEKGEGAIGSGSLKPKYITVPPPVGITNISYVKIFKNQNVHNSTIIMPITLHHANIIYILFSMKCIRTININQMVS